MKPLSEFSPQKLGRLGVTSVCKPCNRIRAKGWREANRERSRAAARRWEEANPERYAQLKRNNHLRQYGITVERYDELLEAQDNGCAICGNQCPTGRRLAVDHCHESGEVRGLLCGNCNRGLGYFQDDPELLMKAADYRLQLAVGVGLCKARTEVG